jgi:hypothetical protein
MPQRLIERVERALAIARSEARARNILRDRMILLRERERLRLPSAFVQRSALRERARRKEQSQAEGVPPHRDKG